MQKFVSMSPTSEANTLTVICLTALSDWRRLYFVKIVWIMNMYNAFRTDNKFLIGHETNLNMRMREGNSYLAFSISRCQDTAGWVEAVAPGTRVAMMMEAEWDHDTGVTNGTLSCLVIECQQCIAMALLGPYFSLAPLFTCFDYICFLLVFLADCCIEGMQ